MPPTERPTRPDAVRLRYSRSDGGERLEIYARAREHDLPVVGEERRFEHAGRRYIALGPERPSGLEPAILIFAAGSTQIRMSSSALTRERMLRFAASLIEA